MVACVYALFLGFVVGRHAELRARRKSIVAIFEGLEELYGSVSEPVTHQSRQPEKKPSQMKKKSHNFHGIQG